MDVSLLRERSDAWALVLERERGDIVARVDIPDGSVSPAEMDTIGFLSNSYPLRSGGPVPACDDIVDRAIVDMTSIQKEAR